MVIQKVINNNIVSACDDMGREVVVMGRGLGFGVKPGMGVDESKIEKVFRIESGGVGEKFRELLSNIPSEHAEISDDIISYAESALKLKLNQSIYVTLTDHINFAIERWEKGINLENALLWEIRRFYPQEYELGEYAVKLIGERLGIFLPEDEAGFIAFHLVNADMDGIGIGQGQEMMKTIQNIINIVKYHYNIELNENSIHYERFVTHLKFFLKRVFSGQELEDGDLNFFLMIRSQYKKAYACVLKVYDYIQKEYGLTLTNDEMMYLTVHIHRITAE